MRRVARWAAAALGLIAVAAAGGAFWLRAELRASLPVLDGDVPLAGLSAPVQIEFDALGVPTIHAATRLDAARATGFLHAQNRFFQMDLMRRRAAGELAELFGPQLLPADRDVRVHRFRDIARRILLNGPAGPSGLLAAYAEGVNAGLGALDAKPFEYLLLRAEPSAWLPEDSVLVILAMFLDLNDERGGRESALGLMHDLLPPEMFAFLAQQGTEWDAPVVGGPLGAAPVPGPEVFDLRREPPAAESARAIDAAAADPEPVTAGSNSWAVGGALTAHGGALLANDMHLGLGVPNIWYRLAFELSRPATEGPARAAGVTLPGVPHIVAGSNGHIAWGFTNSQGDWVDLVQIETDPDDPDVYRTPAGPRRFERHEEILHVRGAADETLEVRTTIWGPIIDQDHRGRRRALRWTAHDEHAVNAAMIDLERARSVQEALEAANRSGIPPQNIVVVDRAGRVGWSIMGAIPRRFGFDGVMDARLPHSWADGTRGWDGWLEPDEYPRILRARDGRIWTANARVVGGESLLRIGDGGYDLGARAGQIRDRLQALESASEGDMLAIQLDDQAIFLERWRDLILDTLTAETMAGRPERRAFRQHVESWGGRAAVDSVGYRLVRSFRLLLARQLLSSLTAACRKADDRFNVFWLSRIEGPLWSLVSQRPLHLLEPRYKSWDGRLLAAVDATIEELTAGGKTIDRLTWGDRNTVRLRHPLSYGAPFLSTWLDMPALRLPGDSHMPRVQHPNFGASERMVVSPGREEDGLFHMPCGQSGHPLSPHYRDGHAAWAEGAPTPFLPGPPVHRLALLPS